MTCIYESLSTGQRLNGVWAVYYDVIFHGQGETRAWIERDGVRMPETVMLGNSTSSGADQNFRFHVEYRTEDPLPLSRFQGVWEVVE